MSTKLKKYSLNNISKLMDELEAIHEEMEDVSAHMSELKESEAKLYEIIMPLLLDNKLQSATSTSGTTYYVNPGRVTWGISKFPGMKEKAVKWAIDNFPGILTIGAADLGKVCKPMPQIPEFVERKEGASYLAVR